MGLDVDSHQHVLRGLGLNIFSVVFVVFEVLTSFFLLFLGYLLLLQ